MSPLSRREVILAAGAAGLGAVFGLRGVVLPRDAGAATCLLQREVTEGPYYLDLDRVRRNIKGGRKGTPLTLRFQVVDATTCKPIRNAAVEIWHTDADGWYSGGGVEDVSGQVTHAETTPASRTLTPRSSITGALTEPPLVASR